MKDKKGYFDLTIEIILLDGLDVITASNPVSGEDGNDIFDDR